MWNKKLKNLGSDLGYALKGFQNAVKDEPAKEKTVEKSVVDETTR
ncbi:twin-arginine translocase TatA/TatE family subunit [Photobacterium angustum]